MSVPLHVQHEQVGPTVAVQIGNRGVAGPPLGLQADLGGHVLESVVPQIPVEDGVLEPIRVEVAHERVRQPDVRAIGTLLIDRVLAHVADEQIEQAVVVVVEEDRA